MKRNTWRTAVNVGLGLLTIVAVSACTKDLSNCDAKALLAESSTAHAPRCAMHERDTEHDPIAKTIRYRDRQWGQVAETIGFVSDIKCPNDPAGIESCTAQLVMAPDCADKRLEQGALPRMTDCTLRAPCGRADLEVESIVTEGKRATVRYKVKPDLDDVVAKVLAPKPEGGWLGGKVKVTGDQPSDASAVFVRTDEGKWLVEKK